MGPPTAQDPGGSSCSACCAWTSGAFSASSQLLDVGPVVQASWFRSGGVGPFLACFPGAPAEDRATLEDPNSSSTPLPRMRMGSISPGPRGMARGPHRPWYPRHPNQPAAWAPTDLLGSHRSCPPQISGLAPRGHPDRWTSPPFFCSVGSWSFPETQSLESPGNPVSS